MAPSARARRLRWSAPFAVAAVIALIVAVPGLSSASTPSLPALTPAQLLAKVTQANVTDLSGTIDLSTNLGIPDLSELSDAASGGGGGGHGGQAFDPTVLLSGNHQALVWVAGPDQNRVDLLESMAETDVIHDGQNVWTWDSATKKVTHYTLAAQGTAGKDRGAGDATTAPAAIKTPQQVADDLLAQITPSTEVSVGTPVAVAGRKSYLLVLAPRSAQSTIDHVAIAVDSVTGLPLQVQIFAKGQKAAAVKLGFGQISFSTPKASEFTFTPPAGSTVTNSTGGPQPRVHRMLRPKSTAGAHVYHPPVPKPATGKAETSVTVGQDWTAVRIFSNVAVPAQFSQYLEAGTSVSGAFGTGKLLQTAVVNILVLNDGRVAVGAVNASALEAAVAAAP